MLPYLGALVVSLALIALLPQISLALVHHGPRYARKGLRPGAAIPEHPLLGGATMRISRKTLLAAAAGAGASAVFLRFPATRRSSTSSSGTTSRRLIR